jgi:hypothetical protein
MSAAFRLRLGRSGDLHLTPRCCMGHLLLICAMFQPFDGFK